MIRLFAFTPPKVFDRSHCRMKTDEPAIGRAAKYIRQSGHSMTGPRYDVVKLLSAPAAHLNADQIYESIGKYRIDRSTLYRVLDLLCDLRVIRKVPAGNRKPYYELSEIFSEDHAHLMCTTCKRLINLPEAADLKRLISRKEKPIGRKYNFQITGNRLEYQGLCPDCASIRKSELPRAISNTSGRDWSARR